MEIDPKDKYVLCVGMCVLDIIHICDAYPEEDTDTRSKFGRWQRGGNASNVCTVLAQLGTNCEYMGAFSTNKMFKFVIDDLVERGIRISNCSYHDNCEAPISSIILSGGQRTIVFSNPNLPHFQFDDFRRINLNHYDWIHFEARNHEETIKMINLIVLWNKIETKPNIKISVEFERPSDNNLILAEWADVVFIGKEFASHYGYTKMTACHEMKKYAKKESCQIICPWGTDGITALDVATNELHEVSAWVPDKVIDTLGAGDTFVAACISSLNKGHALRDAVEFGSRVAGTKVGFYGYDDIGPIFRNDRQ